MTRAGGFVLMAFVVSLAAVAPLGISAQNRAAARSPTPALLGHWKLNLQKSEFPGPVPKEEVRTYEDWGGGLMNIRSEGIDAEGTPTLTHYVARYDGRDYPFVVRGSHTAGTIALKLVDAFTSEYKQKEDGKVSVIGTRTLSHDGRTMTITSKGANTQGQVVTGRLVFDKLPGIGATD